LASRSSAAAFQLAEVVQADDVGVVEAGRGLGFAAEAAQRGVVSEAAAQHDLDRHPASQAQVARLVDRAHPSPADQLIETVLLVDGAGGRASRVYANGNPRLRLRGRIQ